MDQVLRSLQEIEDKVSTHKMDFNAEYSKIRLEFTKSYLQKIKDYEHTDNDISTQRHQVDKNKRKRFLSWPKESKKNRLAGSRKRYVINVHSLPPW